MPEGLAIGIYLLAILGATYLLQKGINLLRDVTGRRKARLYVEPHPRWNEHYASLKVYNQTKHSIRCRAIAVRIDIWLQARWQTKTDTINSGNDPFSWHGGNEADGYKRIGKDKLEVLNIAKLEEKQGKSSFVFTFSGPEPVHMKANYKLWLEFYDDKGDRLIEWFGCIGPTSGKRIEEGGLLDELYIGECEGNRGLEKHSPNDILELGEKIRVGKWALDTGEGLDNAPLDKREDLIAEWQHSFFQWFSDVILILRRINPAIAESYRLTEDHPIDRYSHIKHRGLRHYLTQYAVRVERLIQILKDLE